MSQEIFLTGLEPLKIFPVFVVRPSLHSKFKRRFRISLLLIDLHGMRDFIRPQALASYWLNDSQTLNNILRNNDHDTSGKQLSWMCTFVYIHTPPKICCDWQYVRLFIILSKIPWESSFLVLKNPLKIAETFVHCPLKVFLFPALEVFRSLGM